MNSKSLLKKTRPSGKSARVELLDQYLKAPGSLGMGELCKEVGAANEHQIRHWRDSVRRPRPAYAVAIERVTQGKVPRWAFYPHDWYKTWPEAEYDPVQALQAAKLEAPHYSWDAAERQLAAVMAAKEAAHAAQQ